MKFLNRKIVLLGCQKIAIDIIDYIVNNQVVGVLDGDTVVTSELVGVITHDEERDKIFSKKSVSEFCDEKNIFNFRYPDDKRIDSEEIAKLNPDIIFSIYYRRLLPKEMLEIPHMGSINLHPAVLPKDRGPNPTLWMILRGEKFAGATLHYIDEGMDTGDIIDQYTNVPIGSRTTGFELNKTIMDVGLDLFKKNYSAILCGNNKRIPQDDEKATCNMSFKPSMRYIDWSKTNTEVISQIRAYAPPYAGALAVSKRSEVLLKFALPFKVAGKLVSRNSKGPGSYEYDGNNLIIQTRTNPILLRNIDFQVIKGELKKKGRFS